MQGACGYARLLMCVNICGSQPTKNTVCALFLVFGARTCKIVQFTLSDFRCMYRKCSKGNTVGRA